MTSSWEKGKKEGKEKGKEERKKKNAGQYKTPDDDIKKKKNWQMVQRANVLLHNTMLSNFHYFQH